MPQGDCTLAEFVRPLGQRVFYPPNVKGWDGGRQWINATTLIGRVNLITKLLRDDNVRFAGRSLTEYFNRQNAAPNVATSAQLVDALASLLLAVPLPPSARRELITVAQRHEPEVGRAAGDVLRTFAVLPEFQLG